MRETCEQKAKYPSELSSAPSSALIRSSTFNLQLFLHQHTPQRWLKNCPLLNPTSVLSRISYTRNPHPDPHCALAFPRFAFLRYTGSSLCYPSFHGIGTSTSLGLVGWKGRGWNRVSPPCSRCYPAALLELEWIRSAYGLEKL